ncbi:formimidoylglutamase [Vibrio maerlii]|uniref:formimidoylglutamase n=1 Tax=Vibrio maerlii TaxID=2231648 RepID=UPI000E3E2D03|nr:formimidoylglutamase [Vibrio maerlii]
MTDLDTSYVWQGRNDAEDGELGLRVHHIVCRDEENDSNVALLGFATDEGVKRNKGRTGAIRGPDEIRNALSSMAWHCSNRLTDLGNIVCNDGNLETSQSQCAQVITQALSDKKIMLLGGGHEIAFSSFKGIVEHLKEVSRDGEKPKLGIINFDAHFDLRAFQHPTQPLKASSGTPFNQSAQWCRDNNWSFLYTCIGVSRASNTQALYDRANALNVLYIEDNQLNIQQQSHHLASLNDFIGQCDYLYLTIDLDVFSSAIAPGVSAPNPRGMSYEQLWPFIELTLQHNKKILVADIAEYNPTYDIDHSTARLAARLSWEILHALLNE